jgi:hypothetical protein
MNTTISKSTDQSHRIQLKSEIIYAIWLSKRAYGGSEAQLEVRTSFVGEGASIKIKGKSSKGIKPVAIDGKIFSNRFIGTLPIPSDIDPEADIWFEVKLPKHGLKTESNVIPAVPPIICTRMQWDRKQARRDDTVKLTADFQGIREQTDATVLIYEFDRDGNHDKLSTIPTTIKKGRIEIQWEYRYCEDTDDILTEKEQQHYGKKYNPPEYFFMVLIDGIRFGAKQESGLLEFRDWIEIEAIDYEDVEEGEPMSGAQYAVTLADGTQKKGTLDDKGYAKVEDVPPGPYDVEIIDP